MLRWVVRYQQELIRRVREICVADDGLDAALMYGSFVADEADEHSDIEFWLFFTSERRARLDPRAWCSAVAPVSHGLVNEFGTYVAFFPGLVRGEFHFATTDDVASIAEWPARGGPVDRMLIVDRRGALEPVLRALPQRYLPNADDPAAIAEHCEPCINWLVLAYHLTARGEYLRAWDALGHAHRRLVWIARLAEHATEHWLTPERAAERELSARTVADLQASTGAATEEALAAALRAASSLCRRLWQALADRHGQCVPVELFDQLDGALAGFGSRSPVVRR